jgi:hypothetical protein
LAIDGDWWSFLKFLRTICGLSKINFLQSPPTIAPAYEAQPLGSSGANNADYADLVLMPMWASIPRTVGLAL